MSQIIPSDDYSAFYLPVAKAIATSPQQVSPPTTPVAKVEGADEFASWGDNNDFPQRVIKDVRADPELPNMLDEKPRLLIAGGLEWGIPSKDDKGKDLFLPVEPAINLDVKTWCKRANIGRYLYESAKDLYWFYNSFPELVLSTDRSKIVAIVNQAAEDCRWGKQNPSTGLVEKCYINKGWPDAKATDANTKVLPVLDPYYSPADTLLLRKETNFIYPLSIPTPGCTYYQLADWNSIRESGWLAVSKAIPKFKSTYLDKQMSIKYHIEVSDQFWPKKYEGFESKTPAEKANIKTEEFRIFQELLTGLDKAGSNLFTPFITDLPNHKEYSLWKVTVLNDKFQSGVFLEDGKDASLYKMAAMGIHPALLGTMPNNGLGGAGSNIREAHLLYTMKIKPHQDLILEPLNNVVVPYNKWPDDMEFRFKNSFMTTLDKGSETSKTIA